MPRRPFLTRAYQCRTPSTAFLLSGCYPQEEPPPLPNLNVGDAANDFAESFWAGWDQAQAEWEEEIKAEREAESQARRESNELYDRVYQECLDQGEYSAARCAGAATRADLGADVRSEWPLIYWTVRILVNWVLPLVGILLLVRLVDWVYRSATGRPGLEGLANRIHASFEE